MSYKTHRYIKNTFGIVPEVRLGKKMTYLVENKKLTITSWSGVPKIIPLTESTSVDPLTDKGLLGTAQGIMGFGDVVIKNSSGEHKIEGLKNIKTFINAVHSEIGIIETPDDTEINSTNQPIQLESRGSGRTFNGISDPLILDRYETFLEIFENIPSDGSGFLAGQEELLYTCPILDQKPGDHRIYITSERILTFQGEWSKKKRTSYFVISIPHFSVALIQRNNDLFTFRRIDGPLPDRYPYKSYTSALEDAKRYKEEFGMSLSHDHFPMPTTEEEQYSYHALAQISGDAGQYNVGSSSSGLARIINELHQSGAFPNEAVIRL